MNSGFRCCFLFQFADTDIPEFHGRSVSQKADMAGFVEQSRMGFAVHRAVLRSLFQVAIHDDFAVEGDFDAVAVCHDLFHVPFARGLEESAARGDDADP